MPRRPRPDRAAGPPPGRQPRTAALALLGRRDYTAAELRQKLLDRGYPDEAVQAALDSLRADGFLDDRRVAAAVLRTAVRVKGRGRVRIARDLEARGVDRAIIHDVISGLSAEDESDTIARVLSRKRWPERPTLAERRRMFQHLLRRGFTAEAVTRALRHREDE